MAVPAPTAPDGAGGWAIVCKLANGFSAERLDELNTLLTQGDKPLMKRLDASAPLPTWMPPSAKGTLRPGYVLCAPPRPAASSPEALVWEVKGNEFTEGSKATGSQISIRCAQTWGSNTGPRHAALTALEVSFRP